MWQILLQRCELAWAWLFSDTGDSAQQGAPLGANFFNWLSAPLGPLYLALTKDPLLTTIVGGLTVVGLAGFGKWLSRRRRIKKDGPQPANLAARPRDTMFTTGAGQNPLIVHPEHSPIHVPNIQGISPEDYDRKAEELGVTKAALQSFFAILERQQVPPNELDNSLREIATQYKDLLGRLAHVTGDDDEVVALKQQAKAALEQGDFEEAETLLNQASEKARTVAERHLESASTYFLSAAESKAENGQIQATQLDYVAAAGYYQEAAELAELAPEHALVLATYLNKWGHMAYRAGGYREADSPWTRALEIREKALGSEHAEVAASLNNLAELYRAQGQYAEAEPLYERALQIDEAVYGPNHPDVTIDLNNLAELYRTQGKYAEAEPFYQRALTIFESTFGDAHPYIAGTLRNYAFLLQATQREAEAQELRARAAAME